MKVAVLGTGTVGITIASKLVSEGHEVTMGSRTPTNEKAASWVGTMGSRAFHGDFAQAASAGEMIVNCTRGTSSLEALRAAGSRNLDGKLVIDISNPLVFSQGMPPRLLYRGEDSVGEQIQKAFPGARVVKTLNTVNAQVMVNPRNVPGEHDVFMSGNDAEAKARVASILRAWGWQNVVDLGDITTARGTEAYLLFWLCLRAATKTADFNVHIVRGPA